METMDAQVKLSGNKAAGFPVGQHSNGPVAPLRDGQVQQAFPVRGTPVVDVSVAVSGYEAGAVPGEREAARTRLTKTTCDGPPGPGDGDGAVTIARTKGQAIAAV